MKRIALLGCLLLAVSWLAADVNQVDYSSKRSRNSLVWCDVTTHPDWTAWSTICYAPEEPVALTSIDIILNGFSDVAEIWSAYSFHDEQFDGWTYNWDVLNGNLHIWASGPPHTIWRPTNIAYIQSIVPSMNYPLVFIPLRFMSCELNEGQLTTVTQNGGALVNVGNYYGDIAGVGDVDLDNLIGEGDAWYMSLREPFDLGTNNPIYKVLADVSLDGTVSALDASIIMQYSHDLLPTVPFLDDPSFFEGQGLLEVFDVSDINEYDMFYTPIQMNDVENVYSLQMQVCFDSSLVDLHAYVLPDELETEIQYMFEEADTLEFFMYWSEPRNIEEVSLPLRGVWKGPTTSLQETDIIIRNVRWNEGEVVENAGNIHIALDFTDTDDTTIPAPATTLACYPNPFNPSTTVRFTLAEAAEVSVTVYNTRGQLVDTLVEGTMSEGEHSIAWDAQGQASGLYLLRMTTPHGIFTRKALLIK